MEFFRRTIWLLFTSALSLFGICIVKGCTRGAQHFSDTTYFIRKIAVIKESRDESVNLHNIIVDLYAKLRDSGRLDDKKLISDARKTIFDAKLRCERNSVRMSTIKAVLSNSKSYGHLINSLSKIIEDEVKAAELLDSVLRSPESKNLRELEVAVISLNALVVAMDKVSFFDLFSTAEAFVSVFWWTSSVALFFACVFLFQIGVQTHGAKDTKSE